MSMTFEEACSEAAKANHQRKYGDPYHAAVVCPNCHSWQVRPPGQSWQCPTCTAKK